VLNTGNAFDLSRVNRVKAFYCHCVTDLFRLGIAAEPPLTAARYAQQLGVGMDVDWARTERGIREFDPLVVRDFRAKGITMCASAWPMSRRKRG
jgi:hypothetical protein